MILTEPVEVSGNAVAVLRFFQEYQPNQYVYDLLLNSTPQVPRSQPASSPPKLCDERTILGHCNKPSSLATILVIPPADNSTGRGMTPGKLERTDHGRETE